MDEFNSMFEILADYADKYMKLMFEHSATNPQTSNVIALTELTVERINQFTKQKQYELTH